MTENQSNVRVFHEIYHHPFSDSPKLIEFDRAKKRVEYIISELQEYLEAIEKQNYVKAIDALGDAQYFLDGTVIEHGFEHNELFKEVQLAIHEANMTKICTDMFILFDTVNKYEKEGREVYHETHEHPEIGVYYVVKDKKTDKVLKSTNWVEPEDKIYKIIKEKYPELI